jgi:hypothetical protein
LPGKIGSFDIQERATTSSMCIFYNQWFVRCVGELKRIYSRNILLYFPKSYLVVLNLTKSSGFAVCAIAPAVMINAAAIKIISS